MHSCMVKTHDKHMDRGGREDLLLFSPVLDTDSHIDTAGHIEGGGEGRNGEKEVGREGGERGLNDSSFGGFDSCPACPVSPA